MATAIQTLGRYRLERKIDAAAMGVVYEALDPKLNRPVAIKTILKNLLDEEVSREYSVRFREEAQAVARLSSARRCRRGEGKAFPFRALVRELP